MKGFLEFNFHKSINSAIEQKNYQVPTKVQKKVIPLIQKGLDTIVASKSGTGKTATYVLPLLDKVNKNLNFNNRVLRALILVPTRELVEQVSKSLNDYGSFLKVKHTKIMGGSSKTKQEQIINLGVDIIVATPGRLIDLVQSEILDLSSVNFVVLDEADTMLEMGFLEEIEQIFSFCSSYKQIVMCSATISQNIARLGKKFLQNPMTIQIHDRRDTVDLIEHKAYKVDKKRKKELVTKLIIESNHKQILLFVNQKDSADLAQEYFLQNKIKSAVIHGDIEYKLRVQAIKDFRNKKIKVLIATDIAGRGLDIEKLPLVINYNLPEATDDFTHRVGRTGRAGNKGEVITILTVEDYNHFTKIERDLKLNVKRLVDDEFPLRDRQPRQKIQQKRKLSEKKSKGNFSKKEPIKSKKTTKRDANRKFRK